MSSERLSHAIAQGGLVLPDGPIAWVGAPADAGLDGLDPAQLTVIQRDAMAHAAWSARGVNVATVLEGEYAAVIVSLARARDLSEDRIARAATHAPLVIVEGAKTDGIEAVLKALKPRVQIDGQVSKAHGKCLWFSPAGALTDWLRETPVQNAHGDWVAPGVFSADAPDEASVQLARALPPLKGRVADLGAGWGWLSREILTHEGVKSLHMVESDKTALDCARLNVTDPRAQFYWADATDWTPPREPGHATVAKMDAVVMNPPFHTGRNADPALGRAFIANAQAILAPHGHLWLVANRHLPYETALSDLFREVSEIAGDNRFKVLHATRPTRPRR
ncbi:class I SAM-dependent methyltransferase [Sagittula salina]|uniref:Class I SAM-dependent methyltransferase n=1 Tax=Sagittula salina TaxID=2820268 RepID=A0A940MP04_9RHOB|nr:methyltransferase [Sagittula salina]MBP0482272.1 class I SAM-dependent methyltransferase [Sagittula salina]